jgi:alpha-1,2-mannosyltransferase
MRGARLRATAFDARTRRARPVLPVFDARTRRERRACPGLALPATAWAIALAAIGYQVWNANSRMMIDLGIYRMGGQAILHGTNLYALTGADRLAFTYPPVAAILAAPLALVPFAADKLIWTVMVYLPLLVAVRAGFRPLLARLAGSARMAALPLLLAACAYLQPAWQEIGFGQIDLFLVGLCLLDCLVTAPKWPRGLLIGLAAAIKLEPMVFIVYLLITRRWRAAGVAALSFTALCGLAWLLNPRDSISYWTSAVFDPGRLGSNASTANQSLRGIVLRLHLAAGTQAVWLVLALVVAVSGFLAARACWQHGQELAGIAITGLLSALLSPVAWIHHLCWVIVAIGVIAGDCRRPRRVFAAVVTGLFYLTLTPVWVGRSAQLPTVIRDVLQDSFGLAALALIPLIWWLSVTSAADDELGQVLGPDERATVPAPLTGIPA